MPFHRSSPRYSHTPEPATPYQAAQQQWDERIGAARVQAAHWRTIAFGAMALAFVMSGGFIWQSNRSTVTPYIVEVDTQGAVRGVGPVVENYRPTEAQMAYHLSKFLRNVRSLPLDPIVVRENWLEAYDFTTMRGAVTLNEYARQKDPFAQVGRTSVTADVTSVVRASDNSFQLRWIERTYNNGTLASTEYWTGILSIIPQTPKDIERIRKNPLGIYVDGLDWSRELTPNTRSGDSK